MPSIKFNQLTKEIEVRGSKSFIESNFNKIQDLLVESFGEKKIMVSRRTKTSTKSISHVEIKESQAVTQTDSHELIEASPVLSAAQSSIPEYSHELKVNRPPLRKYIRKEGMPGQQRMVIEIVEQKPKELSIESLKEKFGLSDSKIGGIIRDAEKLGKVRRSVDGSYSWI